MTKDIIRFTFRLPERLLGFLKQEAKSIGISTNALILQILWDWTNYVKKARENKEKRKQL